jgi:hypothetical protein
VPDGGERATLRLSTATPIISLEHDTTQGEANKAEKGGREGL